MFEECLYFNSNALARAVTKIWTDAYKVYDLSPPHAFLLRLVLAKPGLLPRELAAELSLSRSTITRFLDSLEKRDLLTRKPTGTDGRELQVFPTEQAQAIHQQLDATGAELTRQMRALVGTDDLTVMVADIRKVQMMLDDS